MTRGKALATTPEFVEGKDGLGHISREIVKDASLAELMDLFRDENGQIEDSSQVLGDGVELVDKDALVGVSMFLYDWSFQVGDKGQYVVVHAAKENGEKIVFVDGGTGICRQLLELTETRQASGFRGAGGLLCRRGLRRSDYEANDERPAGTTFYIA